MGQPRARVDGVQLLRVKGGPKGIGAQIQRPLRSAKRLPHGRICLLASVFIELAWSDFKAALRVQRGVCSTRKAAFGSSTGSKQIAALL